MKDTKPIWVERLGRTVLGLVVVGVLVAFLVPSIQARAIRLLVVGLGIVFLGWLVSWGVGGTNLLPPPFGTVFAWLWRSGSRNNDESTQ